MKTANVLRLPILMFLFLLGLCACNGGNGDSSNALISEPSPARGPITTNTVAPEVSPMEMSPTPPDPEAVVSTSEPAELPMDGRDTVVSTGPEVCQANIPGALLTGTPVAFDDVAYTEAGLPVIIAVLSNDTGMRGGILVISRFTQTRQGALQFNSDSSFTYTPHVDFSGIDTFTYTVSDDNGDMASAVVTIAVQMPRRGKGTTIAVNSFAQHPATARDCTLSQAITAANTQRQVGGCPSGSGENVIILPQGLYVLRDVDNLSNGENGLPSIKSKITIEGNGSILQRDAALNTPTFRILHIETNGTLAINNITIRGGFAAFPSVNDIQGDGGAIINRGVLFISTSAITENHASDDSGGIENLGTLVIVNSSLTGNRADDEGGAIRNNAGTLLIIDSTIAGNSAEGAHFGADGGGGIENSGTLMVARSSIVDNRTQDGGGGISNSEDGQATFQSSSIRNNKASNHGGGIRSFGQMYLNNVTITANSADRDNQDFGFGGGIYSFTQAFIRNTRIADNLTTTGDPDCYGIIGTISLNLIGSNAGCSCALTGGDASTGSLRFAVIGDFGFAGAAAENVARRVKSWDLDLIITTGDNNYPDGEASVIDQNIGQYYHEFIYPYKGNYGLGSAINRFFPSLGNHDWNTANAAAYLDYFELPGNERYYDFKRGPVHFFALDGDSREPDGTSSDSVQARWLQQQLAASSAPFKFVFLHFPPYSSGPHGSSTRLQWPYKAWGADAVLAAHDHIYERIMRDNVPFFVNGLGGNGRYSFETPVAGSEVRYNRDYGAMLVEVSSASARFQFITHGGEVIDRYTIDRMIR